jgi:AcrR family transcriptional regulator
MGRANTLTARSQSRASAPRAGATVERIVDAALTLMNGEGGADVGTNHIATHLGMSPGNLYYHFRNREEIVRAIFPRIAAEGLAATAPTGGVPLDAQSFGARHLEGLAIMWRYRFFFRDLHQLVARDPVLARAYRAFEVQLHAQYRALFEQLIGDGQMRRPRRPEDLGRLTTNSIVVWTNWVAYISTLRPRQAIARRDAIEGALHSFLVVAPLLEPAFAAEARAVIERDGSARD